MYRHTHMCATIHMTSYFIFPKIDRLVSYKKKKNSHFPRLFTLIGYVK